MNKQKKAFQLVHQDKFVGAINYYIVNHDATGVYEVSSESVIKTSRSWLGYRTLVIKHKRQDVWVLCRFWTSCITFEEDREMLTLANHESRKPVTSGSSRSLTVAIVNCTSNGYLSWWQRPKSIKRSRGPINIPYTFHRQWLPFSPGRIVIQP